MVKTGFITVKLIIENCIYIINILMYNIIIKIQEVFTLNRMSEQFEKLNGRFGGNAVLKCVELDFKSKKFFNSFKRTIRTDRCGEVAFALERKNGKFVVIRNNIYPDGIYRIPTGGIRFGEDVLSALYREISEELGVNVELKRFLGAVKYDISYHDEHIDFYSFVFWMKEISGTILKDATQNEISDFAEADLQFLEQISEKLQSEGEDRGDWRSFRFQTTSFIIPFLKNEY